MSDDWNVGDIGLCVDNGPGPHGKSAEQFLTLGQHYRVTRLGRSQSFGVSLHVEGAHPIPYGYAPYRFVKIKHDDVDTTEKCGQLIDFFDRDRVLA